MNGTYKINGTTERNIQGGFIRAFMYSSVWQLSPENFSNLVNTNPMTWNNTLPADSTKTSVEIEFPNPLSIVGYSIKKGGGNNPVSWQIIDTTSSTTGTILSNITNTTLTGNIGDSTSFLISSTQKIKKIKFYYIKSDRMYPTLSGLTYYCDLSKQ